MSADYKHSTHIRIQYNRRGSFDPTDYSLLLQGTKEQIGRSIAHSVEHALDGGASKITIVPVQPHEVWDLDKNPPS